MKYLNNWRICQVEFVIQNWIFMAIVRKTNSTNPKVGGNNDCTIRHPILPTDQVLLQIQLHWFH